MANDKTATDISFAEMVKANFILSGTIHPAVYLRELAVRIRSTEESLEVALPRILDQILDESNDIIHNAIKEMKELQPRIQTLN